MSPKRTIVLAAIFTALAAYFALFEGFSTEPPIPEWERQEKIVACDTEGGIRSLRVSADSKRVVAAERRADGWHVALADPPPRAADAVRDLAEALCKLPVVDRFSEDGSLEQFGLGAARLEIRIETGSGAETLLLGNRTPAGNSLYAKKREAPGVLKLGALLQSEIDKVLRYAPQ